MQPRICDIGCIHATRGSAELSQSSNERPFIPEPRLPFGPTAGGRCQRRGTHGSDAFRKVTRSCMCTSRPALTGSEPVSGLTGKDPVSADRQEPWALANRLGSLLNAIDTVLGTPRLAGDRLFRRGFDSPVAVRPTGQTSP